MLDMALWDAAAKIRGIPLWQLLSESYNEGNFHKRVPVYATGGHYYPNSDLEALKDEIKGYLDQGYDRIKIKCGQGDLTEDCMRIEAVLALLDGDGSRLAVDVNCMCSTSGAMQEMADAYTPYKLAWIEEPGHPHDFELLTALTGYYDGPIATGENLSRCQRHTTCSAMAVCVPTGTWFKWIRRCLMDWSNTPISCGSPKPADGL